MSEYEYGNTWGRLILETALIAFIKANGNARLMLCTRNLDTCEFMWKDKEFQYELTGFDGRCSRDNGNIAVVDLAIGECRSFNIDRVIAIKWFGEIHSESDMEKAIEEYEKMKEDLEKDFGYTVSGGKAKELTHSEFEGPIKF